VELTDTKIKFKFEECGVEPNLGPLGMSANSGLLYLPRVIVRMDNLVKLRLAGETEVLGENLPQRHLFHTNSTCPDRAANPGRRDRKLATNRLSYGAG
jgi:hypothetical protein